MKILIVSDTHGSHRNFDRALAKETDREMLIHLGDVEGSEYYIEATANCPAHIVAGNNDFFSELPQEEVFIIEGKCFWITHGHRYFVSAGEDRIKKEARKRGVDVVIYGHTHRPSVTKEENLLILNPGSLTYPRQEGRRASYIVMDIQENKEPEVEIVLL